MRLITASASARRVRCPRATRPSLTFLPVAGTFTLLLLRGDDHLWIRRLALTTAVAEFAISLLLLRGFDSAATGYQFEEFHEWIPQPPIHYHLGVDGLSLFLVLLTTLLTSAVITPHFSHFSGSTPCFGSATMIAIVGSNAGCSDDSTSSAS